MKRQYHTELVAKVEKLHGDMSEHQVVLRALEAVPGDRRAFSLVGGVLVERTAAQVIPALQTNLHGIKQIVNVLTQRIEEASKLMDGLQAKLKAAAEEVRAEGAAKRAAAAAVAAK